MDSTEKFARFLAEEGSTNLSSLDGWICSHLQQSNSRGWEMSSERMRLASKFIDLADDIDIEMRTAILERIYNAPFKTRLESASAD
jgi:hypothetical protein